MKKVIITILLHCFIVLLLMRIVYADNSILINEFVIDSQPQQVEILNTNSTDIDISGWYLDDSGGTTFATIPQNTILYPNSCYIYSGDLNLNKSSADTVRLFNNTAPPTTSNAQLIDSYSYKSSPGTGIGFSRIPDGQINWTNTNSTIGYFNSSGISCIITPTFTPTPTPTPTNTPSPTIEQSNPTPSPTIGTTLGASNENPIPTNLPLSIDNIFISEVMVHPKTGEKEWIEILNNNNFEVNLIDWYIDDGENIGSTPKKFSAIIPAQSYFILELTSSVFNNDADQVRLLDQNKLEKDSFEYNSSQENISYGRWNFETNDFCLQEPSKGIVNNSCIDPTSTLSSTPTSTIKPTKSSSTPTTINKITPQLINSKPQILNPKQIPIPNFPNSNKINQAVLGVSTINNNFNIKNDFYYINLIKFFSFLSFIYSFLTIFYILIKIKLSYEIDRKIYP
jgi:hypothetical protein